MRRLVPTLLLALVALGCAGPVFRMTYDRYDGRNQTYVNDTAGFAMTFGEGWRVSHDVDSAAWLFSLIPVPTGTEISLKAVGRGVGVLIETSRVPRTTQVDALQPSILKAYAPLFRSLRYQPISLEKKLAHGIEYVEWIYQLSSPDFDRTFVEALFVRENYAVRVRALTNTSDYQSVRDRISSLLASLTAVESAASSLTDRVSVR